MQDRIDKLVENSHKHEVALEKMNVTVDNINSHIREIKEDQTRQTENWAKHMARTTANEERIAIMETVILNLNNVLESLKDGKKRTDTIWNFAKGAAWSVSIIAAILVLIARFNIVNITF